MIIDIKRKTIAQLLTLSHVQLKLGSVSLPVFEMRPGLSNYTYPQNSKHVLVYINKFLFAELFMNHSKTTIGWLKY